MMNIRSKQYSIILRCSWGIEMPRCKGDKWKACCWILRVCGLKLASCQGHRKWSYEVKVVANPLTCLPQSLQGVKSAGNQAK
jgi:hypothetical protein